MTDVMTISKAPSEDANLPHAMMDVDDILMSIKATFYRMEQLTNEVLESSLPEDGAQLRSDGLTEIQACGGSLNRECSDLAQAVIDITHVCQCASEFWPVGATPLKTELFED